MELYWEDADVVYLTQHKDPLLSFVTNKIFSEITFSKGKRVLDMGCGTGRNALHAAQQGFEVVGIDMIDKAIDIAKKEAKKRGLEKNVQFIKADLYTIDPKKLGTFDYIIAQDVLEHVDDYQKLVDWAYSLLKKNGKFIFTGPHDPKQWVVLDEYAMHLRRFTIPEAKKSLQAFRTSRVSTFGFPFLRMALAGYDFVIRKSSKKTHDAKRIRSSRVNMFLYTLFGTVVVRLDSLLNTPWGPVIFAVAQK